MEEHIVDFFNIGTRLTERFGYCVPFIRAINQERKECIVRCRDCTYFTKAKYNAYCVRLSGYEIVEPDGFCAWAVRSDA